MAHDDGAETGAVDYKTLFAGACVLISLLGVAAVSYVIADINGTDKAQWGLLRDINDKVIDTSGRVRRLEDDSTDCRARLNTLEREHAHERSGK